LTRQANYKKRISVYLLNGKKMKKAILCLFIFIISCSHDKTKGRRDIETPTSSGAKTYLTTRPESFGMDLVKKHKSKSSNTQGSAGNKASEGVTDNKSGQ
jgi:hypothetical protein